MTKKEKVNQFIQIMSESIPDAQTELHYNNPYELVTAVILSAQCTDVRVNLVTPKLFKRFPSFEELSIANEDEVFSLIRSISYPNNKSKHLIAMAKMVMENFGGKLPDTMEDLIKLQGVGRKTANVVLSVLHDMPAFAVDTHVFRVSARIGFTENAKNPLQTEKQLMKIFPSEIIPKAHHWLILHGRYVCKARRPECENCKLTHICKYYKTVISKAI